MIVKGSNNDTDGEDEDSKEEVSHHQEPLKLGEKLRVEINEFIFNESLTDAMRVKLFDIRKRLVVMLERIEQYNFTKIEEILTQC